MSRVGALPQLAGASDGADAGGIDGKLGPVPEWQATANYFDPPRIGYKGRENHPNTAHVAQLRQGFFDAL